jgi:hypothetical protein
MLDGNVDYTLNIFPYKPNTEYNISYILDTSASMDSGELLRAKNAYTANSFPVLTIGSLARLDEADYREQCVERLIEIVLDIDNYKGAGRLFIP